MKAILKFLAILAILIVLVLIAGLFLPKESHLKATRVIDASPVILFEEIINVEKSASWSPWSEMDTTIVNTFEGPVRGVGAKQSWTSESSGVGSMTVAESNPNEYARMDLDFGEYGTASSSFILKEVDKGTEVTWTYDDEELGFIERYIMLFMGKQIAEAYGKGLENLDRKSQELKKSRIGDIEVIDVPARHIVQIIDSATIDQIGVKMQDMFAQLFGFIVRREITPVGYPFSIYYKWNPAAHSTFSCGAPIPEKIYGWRQFQYEELPATKAIAVTHWGEYNTTKAHEALNAYIQENNYTFAGPPWEEYVTDPREVADTSMWETRVVYPVQ